MWFVTIPFYMANFSYGGSLESRKPSDANQKVTQKKMESSIGAATDEDLKRLQKIDSRYQRAKSVVMEIDKTLKLGLLGRETKSKGQIQLSKGRMRLETKTPDESLVVVNKNTLWVVNFPPAEFKDKGAAVQVLKAKIDSKKGRSQNLLSLLTQGGLLKFFTVSSVQKDSEKKQVTYFLQPKQDLVEFKRAQVVVSSTKEQIIAMRYWDELDNETQFEFTKVVFDKVLSDKVFAYTPPKNADVTTM